MIKQLLDGNLEGNQYEDMLRDMFGIHAYVAFTMDKLVSNIVRQLQHMVGDDVSQRCYELFLEESKNNATGGPCANAQSRAIPEANYLKRAEQLLEDENCYKATMYKNESKLTIELLDSDSQSDDEDDNSNEKWSKNYKNSDIDIPASSGRDKFKNNNNNHHNQAEKKWFLKRNIRRYIDREQRINRKKNETGAAFDGSARGGTKSSFSECGDTVEGVGPGKQSQISNDKPASGDNNNDLAISDDHKNCSFAPNSCRRLLIFNNGDHVFFYRHQRPTKLRHNKMNDIKRKNFHTWRTKWIDANLSADQIRQGIEWLGEPSSSKKS